MSRSASAVRVVLLLLALVACAANTGRAQEAPDETTADRASSAPRPALLPEPRRVNDTMELVDSVFGSHGGKPKDGFYPAVKMMITGTGISVGPGYRSHLLNGAALFDVSAAISRRTSKAAQARFELPRLAHDRLTIGSQVLWQDFTQLDYFGLGRHSSRRSRTDYRLRTTDLVAYAGLRANRWLSFDARVGMLRRPTLSGGTGWFDPHVPSPPDLFNEVTAPGVARQPNFQHADVSVTVDTRDRIGQPMTGGLYRLMWASYGDRDFARYGFRRYEAEAVRFVPVVLGKWVIGVRGLGVFTDTPPGNAVPFYLLPNLGGQNTLRGYPDYRFSDRNLFVANAESRWAIFRHVDIAMFVDAGDVAPRVKDLALSRLKTSYGIGVRLHSLQSSLGRMDIAHSVEGWRVFFRLGDPLTLSRLWGRRPVVPFVP